MINTLAKTHKPRTVRNVRACLRRALNHALKWRYIPYNPATVVDTPQVDQSPIQPLTQAQALALIKVVKGHRREALYRLALALGLRRGEVIALGWTDIDFDTCVLHIRQTLQRVNHKLVFAPPKTKASVRTLPLPPSLVRALRAHKARQDTERQIEWPTSDLVFVSEAGTPIEPSNVNRQFKALLKCAKLPPTIRFHDLRHSCATFLIAEGINPREVMEYLGHNQISVTLNTYAHGVPEGRRDAANKLDTLLGA